MRIERYTRRGSIYLYGRAGHPIDQINKIQRLAASKGASKIFILDPPSPPNWTGYHRIVSREDGYESPVTMAEGGVIESKSTALLVPTRDCPTLVLENLANGMMGATQAGRESLINRKSPCCVYFGVVEQLISALQIRDGVRARGYILGGISAENFGHTDWESVRPFVELYGQDVVTDQQRMTLDLTAVITAKLRLYGINDICHDGLCTYDHPELGSRRAEKPGMNWVMAVVN